MSAIAESEFRCDTGGGLDVGGVPTTVPRQRGRPRKLDARIKDDVPEHAVCCGTKFHDRHDVHCAGNARDADTVERETATVFGVPCDPEVAWVLRESIEAFQYHRGRIPARLHAQRRGRVVRATLEVVLVEAFELIDFDALPQVAVEP